MLMRDVGQQNQRGTMTMRYTDSKKGRYKGNQAKGSAFKGAFTSKDSFLSN